MYVATAGLVNPSPPSSRATNVITLIRHARSAHEHSGWITADGVRAWRLAYEAAGIGDGERAPAALQSLVHDAAVLVASDAPRAIATAKLLAPTRDFIQSPLVRELNLDAPALGSIRLPLLLWSVAIGASTWHKSQRGEFPAPAERARIAEAAELVGCIATRAGSVAVVTHAGFRHQLAAQLQRDGWRASGGRRSVRPLSAWVLVR